MYVLKQNRKDREWLGKYIKDVSTFPIKTDSGEEKLAIMPKTTQSLEEALLFMSMKVANQYKKMHGLTRWKIIKVIKT